MPDPTQFPANRILKALEDKFLADSTMTFNSHKNDRIIPVWAPRDQKFCKIAERAQDILSFEDRPEVLSLKYRGNHMFYVVDFRVTTHRSTIMVGLSLVGHPGHPDEARIHDLAKACCARRGAVFVHVNDSDLVRLAHMPSAAAA